jgi:hypothetical protein
LKVDLCSKGHFSSAFRVQGKHCLLSASCWFLDWSTFRPWNGSDIFFQNVAWLTSDDTSKFCGPSPRANYTDLTATAFRWS